MSWLASDGEIAEPVIGDLDVWGWGFLKDIGWRESGNQQACSLLQSPAVSTWKKAAGVAVVTNPESAQHSDPSILQSPSPPLPPPPSSPCRSGAQTSDQPTYRSRDKAQSRDHVQNPTLDPIGGTWASRSVCTGDVPPSSVSSSSPTAAITYLTENMIFHLFMRFTTSFPYHIQS